MRATCSWRCVCAAPVGPADVYGQIERLDLLIANVDAKAYPRVTLYLMSCVPYVAGRSSLLSPLPLTRAEPEDSILLNTVLGIFEKFEQWAQALQVCFLSFEHHVSYAL